MNFDTLVNSKKSLESMEQKNYSINAIIKTLINNFGLDAIKENFEYIDVFPRQDAVEICKENLENCLFDNYDFDTIQDFNFKIQELLENEQNFVYYSDIDLDTGSNLDTDVISDLLTNLFR